MRKITFDYNGEKFLNINNVIRNNIYKIYDELLFYGYSNEDIINVYSEIFFEMYEIDQTSFHLCMQTILADTYKMLYYDFSQNTMNRENFYSINVMNLFNLEYEDLLQNMISDYNFFADTIMASIAFSDLNILGKKNVVQNSIKYEEYIHQISPLYRLDMMDYGITNPGDFIHYYDQMLDTTIVNPEVLITNITDHLKHLYIYNLDNYLENIQAMCEVFYKWQKYYEDMNDIDEEKINFIRIIEEKSINEIGEEFIRNEDFSANVVDDFCYFSLIKSEKINERYITHLDIDEFIKDKLPESLKCNYKQKKKK